MYIDESALAGDDQYTKKYFTIEHGVLTEFPERATRVLRSDEINKDSLFETRGEFVRASDAGLSSRLTNASVSIAKIPLEAGASGVFVNHRGKQYQLTAAHVVSGKDEAGKSIKYHKNNYVAEFPINDLKLLYTSESAYERNLPLGDLAIYELPFIVDGVDLANDTSSDLDAVLVGYPARFTKVWSEQLQPLCSYGRATIVQPRPPQKPQFGLPSPSFADFSKHVRRNTRGEIPTQLPKLDFTGVSRGGNSGGGLFNTDGQLIGILSGSGTRKIPLCPPFTRDDEYTELVDVRGLFEQLGI